MFNIGDKVVYPRYGAGIIEAIEEKEILGGKCKYYVLRIPLGDMRVMVPIENIEAYGIRSIIPFDKVEEVFSILSSGPSNMNRNWSKRYRENEVKIRHGDIFEIAEIVKNLTIADRDKKLSTGEKRMLETARQILISELMLVLNKSMEKVEEVTESLIKHSHKAEI
ncbi:MAG: CarD family transcriptional regulator [Caulobacteraceae bacterium]